MTSDEQVRQLAQKTSNTNDVYAPCFFRLTDDADNAEFAALLQLPGLALYDRIYDQLRELFKSRNPHRRLTEADYKQLIDQHLGDCPTLHYGVWVYYPWSNKLVHILDEAEFIELRTAANRNKITTPERDLLQTKKVGVIGLSVGQSVSVTLALERGCGELRLADFDTLELNNLNRIRTGLHNLGLLKACAVAREIAEIDPYFKVTLFTKGVDEDNVYDFFHGGGKLDAVIDECDSVHIKILCRQKAKEYHVPVLMEASDRGTLDIERFDLEPERPIMHGWLEHLSIDFDVLKQLKTTEEKIPYILPISGLDTLSPRMKASMVEIENTLTTWPQLASAVTLGGAITADTCRRIFLDQYTSSGRYFIDMERLLPDERPKKLPEQPLPPAPLDTDTMEGLVTKALQVLPPPDQMPDSNMVTKLVNDAISAPTAGNNQPWKWHYAGGTLYLFHDRNRSFSFGDFEDIASYVGLGGSIENLELAAHNAGIGTVRHYFPVAGSRTLVAAIQFCKLPAQTDLYMPEVLFRQLHERHTNRNLGVRTPIAADKLLQLQNAVKSVPGADFLIKTAAADLEELSDIMASADRLRLLHPEGHYEFYNKELRWNAEHSRVTADGIDLATVDITPLEVVGLKMVKDPDVVQLLIDWKAGNGLKRTTRKSVEAASAVGLIIMPQFSPGDFLLGGRAVERMWLAATHLGIAVQPLAAAILHFARLNHGGGLGMADFMKEEFAALYERFKVQFPESDGKGQVFLCRLSVAEKPIVKSYRLPVNKVLTFAS